MENFTVGDTVLDWLFNGYLIVKVLIGFSIIIFVHELGHFLAAKWMGVRVDRFAVGFFTRVCGYRRGEGFTVGPRPTYAPEDLAQKGYGETDYCLNVLPFGGYVKMMGEEDILVNEETGEYKTTTDPRAFPNKPVWRRMIVVSAGVVFNIVFAILAYAGVYLFLGREMLAPRVGRVEVGSPAHRAGLQGGDVVLAIDGEPVQSFADVHIRSLLGGDVLQFKVQRDGAVLETAVDAQRRIEPGDLSPVGISPDLTTTFSPAVAQSPEKLDFKPGDAITKVAGRPVDSVYEVLDAFERCKGRPVELTVRRGAGAGAGETFSHIARPELVFGAGSAPTTSASSSLPQNLLGLVPRAVVDGLVAGGPGEKAGLKPGDVILRWGPVLNPHFRDITAGTDANDGSPIPVVVERNGARVELSVSPQRPFRLFGATRPMVGVFFSTENSQPIVADVLPGTPAAELGLPRGATLLAVGGAPVANWFDVFERLKTSAGSVVTIRYRAGPDELTAEMAVPGSVVSALALPDAARIYSIDGEDTVILDSGKKAALPTASVARELFKKNIGKTVTVSYISSQLDLERHTKTFAVTAENFDPWQMRALYTWKPVQYFQQYESTVTAQGNPLTALAMGWRQSIDVLRDVYRVIQNMVSPRGRVGVSDVSGPIGIVRAAMRHAESGFSNLMFFLAYISVNLAVINFLPIPVVDGGLMVFLILEKIRGKPLNLKVQVWATLLGLALIGLCFVLVTFQDIAKWVGGSL